MELHVMKALVPILVANALLCAQGSWAPINSGPVPAGGEPALAFDTQRNVSVLFLASQTHTGLNVYERSGGSWSLRGAPAVNVGGFNFTLVYDSARGVSLGVGGGSSLPDNLGQVETRDWNGSLLNVQPSMGQSGRRRKAAAFDSSRQVAVVFGGLAYSFGPGLSMPTDTLLWDGSSWVQRRPSVFPQPRMGHAMAFDSVRGRVVMFGGTSILLRPETSVNLPAHYYSDTWEWDGTTWIERTMPVGPCARHQHAMAYDSMRGVTYLFGGVDALGMPLNDMWAWDGTRWMEIQCAGAPARRWLLAMTYDRARDRLVLFGGLNVSFPLFQAYPYSATFLSDTWEYTPGIPGTFSTFGAGCTGSRGIPTLTNWNGKLPVAGQLFRTQIANLPLVGPTYVFVGASKTSYGSLTLPFDLSVIGMTGCWLNASADVLFPATNVLGTALFDLDIPFGLAGASLYEQAIVFDPPANILGLTSSKGAELKIGG